MFYTEEQFCYAKPDQWDGDFIFIDGVEYEVFETAMDCTSFFEKDGQTYIVKE